MSKTKEALSGKDLAALPQGTIPKCPCCDEDTVTVSMSNERPTKVWCNSCGWCDHLEKEEKVEKKADKKGK